MPVARVMQMPVCEVVHMLAVGYTFVTASWTMLVTRLVPQQAC